MRGVGRVSGLPQANASWIEIVALEGHPSDEHFHRDESERKHVGPGPGRSVAAAELLGCAVLRGERSDVRAGFRQRGLHLRVVGDHLRDTEVENLDRDGPVAKIVSEYEDVWWLDVAMGNAVPVGHVERRRHRTEDLHHLRDRPGGTPRLALLHEDVLERATFEPLEHHVGHPATLGRGVRPDVARLHDGGRLAGELSQEAPFFDEHVVELVPLIRGRIGQLAEELDRNGALPDRVLCAIHDRKAAFANGFFDDVFFGDGLADDVQRIPVSHRLLRR